MRATTSTKPEYAVELHAADGTLLARQPEPLNPTWGLTTYRP